MKRFALILLLTVHAVLAFAKAPGLNVEKLFDGRYNNNKSVTSTVYKNNGKFYRGLTVTRNPAIIKQIADALEKDAQRGREYSDSMGADGRYTSLKVINNGEVIFIGLQRDKTGGGFFFIQGNEKAFK